MTLASGTKLGRYEIRSKIGAGGMGEVYLAQDTKLDRKVALKILPAEAVADRKRMQRFTQEAKAASALNHPNILTIYEIEQIDSTHFIATEFIDGETLRNHLSRARMELHEALDISIEVVSALAAAHAAGIVHRDIKPDNIMRRRDGLVKVLDFGLAKLARSEPPAVAGGFAVDTEGPTRTKVVQTEPGVVLGTASYMSPEQARGSAVDARSDIWSLGVVLYEMVAGRLPFVGATTTDTLSMILHRQPPSLLLYSTELPAEIERIVEKALSKEREERYQSAKDLLIDLRHLKKRLEVDAELERTVPPEQLGAPPEKFGVPPTGGQLSDARSLPPEGGTPNTRATSSAEYIASGIKRHKIAALTVAGLMLIAVVAGGIGIRTYIHARRTEVAIESIAVLPFENQNRVTETDYLSDGVTESIINNITKLPKLRVIARNSVFRYKGKETDPVVVGNQLGVDAVVTGRMSLRGDNLIVSVELVDVRNNKQLWGEQYSRKLSDALAVQQEISREIAERLRLRLTSEDQQQIANRAPNNPEAYQYYLKGRYYWNRRTAENQEKAIDQFIQAVDKDPTYGLAYAGLADCYVLLAGDAPGYPEGESYQKAEEYAKRAVQVGDSLAEAHTSLAHVSSNMWRWEIAEREYRRALELNPNYPTARHWYSIHLRDMGRPDEALAQAKRAHELDPLSSVISSNLAYVYLVRGDVNSCIDESRKVIQIDPNFRGGHVFLGLAYLKQQKYADAVAALEKAVELSGRATVEMQRLGYGYAVSGQRGKALGIIKELEQRFVRQGARGYDIAAVYAGLGEKDQAFEWLEKDFQKHSSQLAGIRWHPPFESLRDDARYQNLLRGMGLTP